MRQHRSAMVVLTLAVLSFGGADLSTLRSAQAQLLPSVDDDVPSSTALVPSSQVRLQLAPLFVAAAEKSVRIPRPADHVCPEAGFETRDDAPWGSGRHPANRRRAVLPFPQNFNSRSYLRLANTCAGPSVVWQAAFGQAPGPNQHPTTPPQAADRVVEIKVFALSDFHGWLVPRLTRSKRRYYGGIANIASFLRAYEKSSGKAALLLDNGDMWTGPVESTFLKGAPVVAAYNALGVAAANVANHEFDFGPAELRKRAKEAEFPFLGANIFVAKTGKRPDFIKPWTIIERQGVKLGVVGLSFKDTPQTTAAKNVEGLRFGGYAGTLRREVPRMKAAGAEVIMVLLHDRPVVGHALVRDLQNAVPIDMIVAGQDHRRSDSVILGVPVVNPGPFGASLARFTVRFDRVERKVVELAHDIVQISGEVAKPPHPPASDLMAIIEAAKEKTKDLAGEQLGRLSKPLPVGGFENSPLGHFIVDSWLRVFSEEMDVAILNHGGIRQPLGAGPVTLAQILGVMPFENNIYIVELTGEQIKSQLAIDHPVVGGMTWTYRANEAGRTVVAMVDRQGQPLGPKRTYRVGILDFMYTGGDGFEFSSLDSAPIDTGLSWRDPVIRTLRLTDRSQRKVEPNPGARARETE